MKKQAQKKQYTKSGTIIAANKSKHSLTIKTNKMKKLTQEEFNAIMDILLRLDKETDMCKHEIILWLMNEIYKIIRFAETQGNTN